jgi:signal transduction histidine kinase
MKSAVGNRLRKANSVSSWFWGAILAGVAALLVIVAILQYRWTAQLSTAAELRLGSKLESQMMSWHLDLYGELSAICVALQVGPDSGTHDRLNDYLQRYSDWSQAASKQGSVENIYVNPDLVQDIYIWETSRKTDARALRLDPDARKILHTSVPTALHPLFRRLQGNSQSLTTALRAWEFRDLAGTPHLNKQLVQLHLLRSNAMTGWQFDATVPAIVHPLVHFAQHPHERAAVPNPQVPVDWIVVVLNLDAIRNRVLPGLAQRYFAGPNGFEYNVAVVAQAKPPVILYATDSNFEPAHRGRYDSKMNIFGPPPESVEGHLWQSVRNTQSLNSEEWRDFSGPVWFPVIQYGAQDEPWTLYLQHREGPLEATVTNVRRSNLVTGGIVLLLLATSMSLLVIASRRAQRLADLQVHFVASISHELRTPLAAILSAGQNITDGFVGDLPRYGSIITTQARQLIDLVDQILLFASLKSGRMSYHLESVPVKDVLEEVRRNILPLIEKSGFNIILSVEEGMPSVIADRQALARCVQNLLNNAAKYSGKSRQIELRADQDASSAMKEVRIKVKDHGVGIFAAELNQIFEPFYRSPQVLQAQIHGTGLGLSVVQHIVESFGGRVSVESELNVGSTFTLHLPAAPHKPLQPTPDVVATSTSA